MAFSLIAAADDDGRRLDRILRKALPHLPLSALHKLLRKGRVLVNGKKARPETRVNSGETISIEGFAMEDTAEGENKPNPPQTAIQPPAIRAAIPKLDILYENEGLLILNKPAGLAAHGENSLEEQVLSYLMPKIPPSLSFKPGPLHRLDKPSSGIITFSTSLEGARNFSALIRERKIKKLYIAIVDGSISEKSLTWEDDLVRDKDEKKTYIAGDDAKKSQRALTLITPLGFAQNHTLILAEIETGRTHQIRAQAAAHGHPLSGDKKYGGRAFPGSRGCGFFLHAWILEFREIRENPKDIRGLQKIQAPLPENFCNKISELFGKEVLQNLKNCYAYKNVS
ncbi:RNA pseudouridine synthase [Spirochaetia bacterium]|nr:RNA pseudouridine synthase [Spirochaetia bacterium]